MPNALRHLLPALLFFVAVTSHAGCLVTKKTCIDPGATRVIDGIAVTRDCWGYEEEKTCLKPDTGTNGCETLSDDQETGGKGHCERMSLTCEASVTDVDGNTVCLKESAVYRCDTKIPLPPVNAAWKGTVTETVKRVQENTCTVLESNSACTKTDSKEEGNILTNTYACSDETLAACTELIDKGCTRLRKPACDAAVDPTCALKVGRVRCSNGAHLPYLENGSVTLQSSTNRADSEGKKDTTPLRNLENATTSCRVLSSVCTDDKAGWRVVNGARIYATCWAYKDTVVCRDTRSRSTCESLEENSRCRITSAECEETVAGVCAKETRHYTCEGPRDSVLEGKGEAVDEIEITEGVAAYSTCSEIESDGACRKISETCEEDGPEGCKKQVLTYACGSAGESIQTNDCTELEDNSSCRLEAPSARALMKAASARCSRVATCVRRAAKPSHWARRATTPFVSPDTVKSGKKRTQTPFYKVRPFWKLRAKRLRTPMQVKA